MRKLEVTALDVARRFLGMKELPGKVANPAILAMLQLDQKWPEEDEVPWCSAFVNYICWLLGLPRSGSLGARSWLKVGSEIPTDLAEPGFDVVVLKRGLGAQPGPDVIAAPGHVAFFLDADAIRVHVLGGNQGDSVNIAPFLRSSVLDVRRLLA